MNEKNKRKEQFVVALSASKQNYLVMFGFSKLTISSSPKALLWFCTVTRLKERWLYIRCVTLTAMTWLHLDTHREAHYFGTLLPLLGVLSGEC